jgi:hypothetical protein
MSLQSSTLVVLLALSIAGCGTAPAPKSADPAGAQLAASPAPPSTDSASTPAETTPAAKAPDDETKGSSTVDKATVVNEPLGGGYLSQSDIRAIVMKNSELFNDCYTIGAGKSQQFVATVTIKATIGPAGAVQISEITKSTANNKKVDTCVADSFKKIKFPAPKGAATAVITFPMEFQGAEEVKP